MLYRDERLLYCGEKTLTEELTPLQKKIIEKLYTHGYIGANQTMIDNIQKGFPKHLRGQVEKETERLMRRGWLLKHPTSYGMRTSINPARAMDAKRITEELAKG